PTAKQLNNTMKPLTHSIPHNNQILQTTNYFNQHSQQQNPYNQPLNKPKNIINHQPTPLIPNHHIQSLLNQVKQTKHNLHPDQKLPNDKTHAQPTLNAL
ncbi:hypothetical protein, partial [Staphylococcus epidermidis]|uniref:hypothetical protein n=1 Tax=Staphylococcus epidermidis TaxID=1282 RepID=UPI0016424E24